MSDANSQTKPHTLPILPENIPPELKAHPSWVLWCWVERHGKATKPPYQPNGHLAKVDDPSTWVSYEEAIRVYEKGGFDGIGIVLTAKDDFVGIDLDKCRDPIAKSIEPGMAALAGRLPTYCEVSPSGTGIRLIATGSLPQGGRRKGQVELYETGRYVTITGHRLNSEDSIRDCTSELAAIHAEVFGISKAKAKETPQTTNPLPPVDTRARPADSDSDLLERIRRSQQGSKFARLWVGPGIDPSADDLALCNLLAFWTGKDAHQMDRLFRQSGLMRPKWDEKHSADGRTFGEMTLDKAIAGTKDVYRGDAHRRGEALAAFGVPAKDTDPLKVKTGLESVSPFSDLGNVHRLVQHFGGRLRFTDSGWAIWDGISWNRVKLEAERLAHELGRIIRREANLASDERPKGKRTSHREDLLRFAGQSEGRKRIVDALELLKREVFIPTDRWNTHRHLLPVANGAVNLKTGNLLAPDPDRLMIGCSPVEFDPAAACPRWLQFLDEVFPAHDLWDGSDLPAFMQRLFGLCLTGENTEHVLPIFWGTGRNGKSVFLNVLQHVLGPFAVAMPADVLASKHMERDTQRDAVLLHGTRVAIASESEAGARLKTAFVKLATGGDRLSGRKLYSEAFSFVPTHKLLLVTNHKPKVPADDEAVWRRLALVPFTRVFSEAEQDLGLTDTLLAEAPGILAWAVRGAGDWYMTGLGRPKEVTRATAEFRNDEDAVQEFLDICTQQNGVSVPLAAMYSQFRGWAIAQGTRAPMSSKAFSARLMTLLGVADWRRSNGARMVDGVRLPSEFDDQRITTQKES